MISTHAPAETSTAGTGDTGRDADAWFTRRPRWPQWMAEELRDDGPVPRALVAVVAVCVVVGVVVRFVTRSHLWLDEALSASIAALPVGEIPEALRHDGHPPLYYVLLHYWQRLAGDGDGAVRALSGLLSVASLPLAYVAGRRAGGRLLGMLALAVFSLSPFLLRYATETRMYALVTLLVLVGYLLVDDVTRRGRDGTGRLVALALVTAALLWSHYWALWLCGGTVVVLGVAWRRGSEPARRRGCARALVALAGGGVLFAPWLPSMLYQSSHTGTPWAGAVRPTSLVATMLTDFGGGAIGATFTEPQLLGAVMLVLVVLGLFGTARGRLHIDLDLRTVAQFRAEAAVVAVTIGFAVVAMYASRSAFASRYASMIVPLVLLVVAGGLSRLRDPRILAGALGALLALSALGAAYNVRTDRTQAARNAARVADRANPGDLVLYCPDQLGPAARRVMPAGLEHLAFPHRPGGTWPVDRVDWVDYKARNGIDPRAYAREVAAHAAGRGLFVLFSNDYQTHVESCGQLIDELAKVRGNQETLAIGEATTYDESSGLVYFAPGG